MSITAHFEVGILGEIEYSHMPVARSQQVRRMIVRAILQLADFFSLTSVAPHIESRHTSHTLTLCNIYRRDAGTAEITVTDT